MESTFAVKALFGRLAARGEVLFFAAMALLFAMALPATAQNTCPTFTYVQTKTVDPGWPDSTTNGFGYHQYMTQPLPAVASRNCIQMPAGFSAHLWASEDPAMSGVRSMVAMAWDEKGRIWGVETSDYPNRVLSNPLPGGGGRDRIVILEDTNGDGIADLRKVFATGFNLLTSIVHTVDGVVVTGAPHIYLFTDLNGDDVADNPNGTILYTGFNRNDTHATLSNLTYGLDNWIYANIGYSGGSNIRNPVTNQTFTGAWGQRVIRFKSNGTSIQSLTATSNNTWGLGISETGQVFWSTANRDHSRFMPYPGGSHLMPIYGTTYARQGNNNYASPHPVTSHVNINNGGYPASSNHSLYTARQFPQKYWDRVAFVCDAPHHLCHEVFLDTNKSAWTGSENTAEYNLFASTDPWTAPIAAHTGPDGGVWVLDWYNYLDNHNGLCGGNGCGTGAAQISSVRDTSRTRIYRVVYDARPLDPILNLSQATEDQLLATLSHTNMLWRLQAQRILIKRGANNGLISKLTGMLNSNAVNDMGESPSVIHALRTLQGLVDFNIGSEAWLPVLDNLLLHPSPGVRWNALDAMPDAAASTSIILQKGRINDPNAHVRLRALHVLTTLPGTKSGEMYTPYVTLDTYSQNRFNAVGGLTQTGTAPTIPELRSPVSIRAAENGGTGSYLLAGMSVLYRNNGLEIHGLDASATGTLTIWSMKGARVSRLSVVAGKVTGTAGNLEDGIHLYRVDLKNGLSESGRFSVFR